MKVIVVKMADFIPRVGTFFDDLLADSDSEFEGFDDGDIDSDREDADAEREGNFNMQNWVEGDRQPSRLAFTGVPGVTDRAGIPENPQVLDYFSAYVKEDDFKHMAVETNRYAAIKYIQDNGPNFKTHSRFHAWKETTWQEMKVFLAMIIAMGLVVQLDIAEYWSTGEVTETPFFSKIMSRDRFWLLMSFFHLANNTNLIRRGLPGHDPLFKLGNFYKLLVLRFNTCYVPNKQLSLDEGMVPWRGASLKKM